MKNRLFFCFLCIFAICQVVIFPKLYMQAFFDGLSLFYIKLLPVLFPFFFFSGILVKTGLLFEISHKFFAGPAKKLSLSPHFPYVFLLSCLSGYPMSAKLTKDLIENGYVGVSEGESIAFSTSCSGILFVCATVGVLMFSSAIIGIYLMIAHILACILGYYLLCFFDRHILKLPKPSFAITPKQQNFQFNIFSSTAESMSSALSSILLVGGYVCIFSVVSKMLDVMGLFSLFSSSCTGFFQGVLEITMGISTLSQTPVSPLSLAFVVALISFGGISINLQSLALLLPCEISGKRYFALKLLQMIVGFCLGLLIFTILGI